MQTTAGDVPVKVIVVVVLCNVFYGGFCSDHHNLHHLLEAVSTVSVPTAAIH
jgi:hypothetical protein